MAKEGVMIKQLRFLSIFILLGILFTVMPASQAGLTTLFGPEVFIRGKGAPITEVKEFSTTGFQGPYILHLRNGDDYGENRVSSATVWLNGGMLFGPSDLSQQVEGYDIEVGLMTENTLEVEIASGPGSKLKIWIEGVNVSQIVIELEEENSTGSFIIAEEGGLIETFSSSGIKYSLWIPPDALFNDQEITMIPISDMLGLPLSYGMTAGVQLYPSGMHFLNSVLLSVELPFFTPTNMTGFIINEAENTLNLHPVLAGDNSITFQLNHFTPVGSGSITKDDLINLQNQKEGLKGEELLEHLIAIVDAKMELDHGSDWKLNINLWEEWEELILEKHLEWYLDENGLEDIRNRAYNDPDQYLEELVSIMAKLSKRADVLGIDPTDLLPNPIPCGVNNICNSYDELLHSLEDFVIDILKSEIEKSNQDCHSGQASGEERMTNFLLLAQKLTLLGSPFPEIYEELMSLKTCGIATLEISPRGPFCMEIDETIQLQAIAKDKDGNILENRELVWAADNDLVVINETEDKSIVDVQTLEKEGAVFINVYDKTTKGFYFDWVEIDVSRVHSIEVIPSAAEIDVGDSTTFKVEIKDKHGNAILDYPIEWIIPVGTISVDLSDPYNLVVKGVEPGEVEITASSSSELDSCIKSASASLKVNSIVDHIEFSRDPFYVCIGKSDVVQAVVKDKNGNTLHGYEIKWSYSSGEDLFTFDASDQNNIVISGVALGRGALWANCEGIYGYLAVYVQGPVASIHISPSIEPSYAGIYHIGVGGVLVVDCWPKDEFGKDIQYDIDLEWINLDSESGVVSIEGRKRYPTFPRHTGIITGIKFGFTKILINAGDNVIDIRLYLEVGTYSPRGSWENIDNSDPFFGGFSCDGYGYWFEEDVTAVFYNTKYEVPLRQFYGTFKVNGYNVIIELEDEYWDSVFDPILGKYIFIHAYVTFFGTFINRETITGTYHFRTDSGVDLNESFTVVVKNGYYPDNWWVWYPKYSSLDF
jgi:hypothetical protein